MREICASLDHRQSPNRSDRRDVTLSLWHWLGVLDVYLGQINGKGPPFKMDRFLRLFRVKDAVCVGNNDAPDKNGGHSLIGPKNRRLTLGVIYWICHIIYEGWEEKIGWNAGNEQFIMRIGSPSFLPISRLRRANIAWECLQQKKSHFPDPNWLVIR